MNHHSFQVPPSPTMTAISQSGGQTIYQQHGQMNGDSNTQGQTNHTHQMNYLQQAYIHNQQQHLQLANFIIQQQQFLQQRNTQFVDQNQHAVASPCTSQFPQPQIRQEQRKLAATPPITSHAKSKPNTDNGAQGRMSGLKFVSIQLERQSLDKPWGLGFVSSTKNKVLLVRSPSINTNSQKPNENVRITSVRSICPQIYSSILGPLPRIIHDGLFADSDAYLGQVLRIMEDPTLYSREEGIFGNILPGDRVLAIDGRSLPKNSKSVTADIASHLRAIRSFSILVLRHPLVVHSTAVAVQKEGKCHYPLQISSVANDAWNKVFSVLPPLPSSSSQQVITGVSIAASKPKISHTQTAIAKKNEIVHRNPLFFQNGSKEFIPYDDNTSSFDYELYMQEDGTRASLFLPPLFSTNSDNSHTPSTFNDWLLKRKSSWRRRYTPYQYVDEKKQRRQQELQQKRKFQQEQRLLQKQMRDEFDGICDRHASSVAVDFWTPQGFASFQEWLQNRSIRWQRSYSWNKRKRQRIEKECFEQIVHLPCAVAHYSGSTGSTKSKGKPKSSSNSTTSITVTPSPGQPGTCSSEQFEEWLKVRRNQWRMSRRKRKRQRRSLPTEPGTHARDTSCEDDAEISAKFSSERNAVSPRCIASLNVNDKPLDPTEKQPACKRKLQFVTEEDQEMAFIDQILEEKEKEREELRRKMAERPPIDIARFFDASHGIPDDVVVHCLTYLPSEEHGKLLAIDYNISKFLQDREQVWKQLCPSHWVLPRRPRKPWHELYLTRLKNERELHQKRWDDLLVKCSHALWKRDDLQKIEKIVEKAEKDFGFDLNYSSGVVCERNSILNLAVIHGRHKVVRWLVDKKGANIETSDRGNFTPLLNAAWSGDRWLVRFFLQRQSDRAVRGTQHYTQGIAPPGFEGRTAEEWAEKRGHPEVAKLIRLGL